MDKGGGADAGPMLEYGDKALKLQKEQYDYSKEISQPWLQAGTSAIGSLANMMGLQGSTGAKTRDQLYKELSPQYTTQTTTGGGSPSYRTKSGVIITPSTSYETLAKAGHNTTADRFMKNAADANWRKSMGVSLAGTGQTTSSSIDQAGLNAAIDAQLAGQTPDSNFGKLLETYSGQDIYNDPSYKFRLDQGNKAMERQLAASGKYLTPAASLALQEYGQNMGSQEYQNAYNRFNQDQGNLYNRLANLAGMGQTQTGQVIGAGQNYANQGTELYTGMGNSIVAANQANQANSGSMFKTLLNAGANLGAAYMTGGTSLAASDERLKQDIKLIGQENGHNIYEFAYKADPDKKFIGVMAQEVQKTNPDAVEEINGYLAVDYDKIGVNFREA